MLLQETMGAWGELCKSLERSIKGWSFISLDSFGSLGGLITDW